MSICKCGSQAMNEDVTRQECDRCFLKSQVNTLEGALENIQDDNVAKEGRIKGLEAESALWEAACAGSRAYVETLETENESIKTKLVTWQAVKDANAAVCAERDGIRAALNEIMSYTKLGIGSIGSIRGIAGKALGGRKEQSNES
jgi:chromosome segregation ATPase